MEQQPQQCVECGRQLPHGAAFCSGCGRRVETPAQPPLTQSSGPAQEPARKSGSPYLLPCAIIGGVVVLLLLIAALVVGWFVMRNRAESHIPTPTARHEAGADVGALEGEQPDSGSLEQQGATDTSETVVVPPLSSQVAVPSVVGLTKDDAERLLEDTGGFKVVYNNARYSSEYAAARIVSQHPAAGTIVSPGSAIYMAQSLGPDPSPPRPAQPARARAPAQRTAVGGGAFIIPNSHQRRLTEGDLAGMSNWTLTLARNEIYARHGRPFDNSHIRGHFTSQGWYSPNSAFRESWMSATERRNATFIRDYQQRVYGRPATRP